MYAYISMFATCTINSCMLTTTSYICITEVIEYIVPAMHGMHGRLEINLHARGEAGALAGGL